MSGPDLRGTVALVTGGTRGLGLATGLALGRCGVHVWLTHRWGSADEDTIAASFAEAGAPGPVIVEADTADDDAAEAVLRRIADTHGRLDVLVANVCVAAVGGSLQAWRRRDLARCLTASAWSLPRDVAACRRIVGAAPTRVVVMSSDGVTTHHPGYDYVALAKAALEATAHQLDRDGVIRAHVVRTRQALTGGFEDIFDESTRATLRRYERFAVAPQEAAAVVVACVSGQLDAIRFQPIQVDHGAAWADNVLTARGLA